MEEKNVMCVINVKLRNNITKFEANRSIEKLDHFFIQFLIYDLTFITSFVFMIKVHISM